MGCNFADLSQLDINDLDAVQATADACLAVLTDPYLWLWAIFFTVVCGIVGGLIGRRQGHFKRDFILGAALGPVGWLISYLIKSLATPSKPKPPPA